MLCQSMLMVITMRVMCEVNLYWYSRTLLKTSSQMHSKERPSWSQSC